MKLPWRKTKPVVKTRKPRKAQTCFGRVLVENHWFEQRKDGVHIRRRYGRKWQRVGFDVIRDYAIGQFPLPINKV